LITTSPSHRRLAEQKIKRATQQQLLRWMTFSGRSNRQEKLVDSTCIIIHPTYTTCIIWPMKITGISCSRWDWTSIIFKCHRSMSYYYTSASISTAKGEQFWFHEGCATFF
jgi:hypothetical protein